MNDVSKRYTITAGSPLATRSTSSSVPRYNSVQPAAKMYTSGAIPGKAVSNTASVVNGVSRTTGKALVDPKTYLGFDGPYQTVQFNQIGQKSIRTAGSDYPYDLARNPGAAQAYSQSGNAWQYFVDVMTSNVMNDRDEIGNSGGGLHNVSPRVSIRIGFNSSGGGTISSSGTFGGGSSRF